MSPERTKAYSGDLEIHSNKCKIIGVKLIKKQKQDQRYA